MSDIIERIGQLRFAIRQAISHLHDGCKVPDFISLKTAAQLSGFAEGTLRNWVLDGTLAPACGLTYSGSGKRPRIRIDRAKFLDWIKAGRPAIMPPRLRIVKGAKDGIHSRHKRAAGSRV